MLAVRFRRERPNVGRVHPFHFMLSCQKDSERQVYRTATAARVMLPAGTPACAGASAVTAMAAAHDGWAGNGAWVGVGTV